MPFNANTHSVSDSYRRLACAVLLQAIKDTQAGCKDAEQWLRSEHCQFFMDALGIGRDICQVILRVQSIDFNLNLQNLHRLEKL